MVKKQGYKTKSRKMILEFLESKRYTTVSVNDIIDFLKTRDEEVNPTTVYRYLNKLTVEKKVLKFSEGAGKQAVYQIVEHPHNCDGHIHIQCTKCGKLLHLDCDFMEDFRKHLEQNHSFSLECEKSLLYGICNECNKK